MGWLVGGWVAGWKGRWLVGWMVCWLMGWFVGVDSWLIGWLVGWLILLAVYTPETRKGNYNSRTRGSSCCTTPVVVDSWLLNVSATC